MRIMLNNFRYSLMDYKFKGEQALRASGGGNVGWQGLISLCSKACRQGRGRGACL